MDVESWLSIVIFLFLLVLSAFFSGSESAYFSITKSDLRRLREDKQSSKPTHRVLVLLEKPRRLLMSILVGNTIVNVAAATIAALFTSRMLPADHLGSHGGILIEIVVVTLVLLVFCEVSPKVFAVRNATHFAKRVSLPLSFIVSVLWPLTILFEKAMRAVSAVLGVKKEIPFGDAEELKTLFEVGEEQGALDQNEREMIHSIFEFRETTVKEVMIPRMDMVRVEQDTPIEKVLSLVKQKGHSRIPVYEEKVDNIIGILFVKDLLPYMRERKELPSLKDLVRKAYFVPESKMIDELLREFQKERIHMAIVVDEYGGTAGLVTLEDVLEEIVGEIQDEYDREMPLIKQVDDGVWLVEAKIDIEELNECLGLEFPAEEGYESLGGFIFHLMGRIPNEKEEVRYQDHVLIVEKVQRHRIQKVRIIKKSDPSDDVSG